MVQLDVLSGQKRGVHWVSRRVPVRIGRAPNDDLQLEDPGVWEQHLVLEVRQPQGLLLTASPNALVAVNDVPVQSQFLRNGDVITLGSAKLRFGLAPVKQRGLRMAEIFAWTLVASVTVGQMALIDWLVS